jgi:hypothetical protein
MMADKDEEIVRIATGLTEEEWVEMWWVIRVYYQDSDLRYASLIRKGVATLEIESYRVTLTPLGRRVWEWHSLF